MHTSTLAWVQHFMLRLLPQLKNTAFVTNTKHKTAFTYNLFNSNNILWVVINRSTFHTTRTSYTYNVSNIDVFETKRRQRFWQALLYRRLDFLAQKIFGVVADERPHLPDDLVQPLGFLNVRKMNLNNVHERQLVTTASHIHNVNNAKQHHIVFGNVKYSWHAWYWWQLANKIYNKYIT